MKTALHLRRTFLGAVAGLMGCSTVAGKVEAAIRSPGAAEGPFYPKAAMRKPDTDNDLVKIAGRVEEAGGEIFWLRGTLKDRHGKPLAGHRVEIWQCDFNGKYMHPGDHRSLEHDPAFQGFGHDLTDEAGSYVFRTIKPTIYPGRTPHIHVKVLDGERELLTTQFYIQDEPNNARDGLYNRMSQAEADAVSMVFEPGETGTEATIDLVI